MWGWVCRLQLLLVLASAVILSQSSAGFMTTFYRLRFDTPPTWRGRIYVPRNRVAQLYPQALGSIFVASYDSQDCGGSILTRLHTGPGTDCTENVFSIIACSHVDREACPQSCSLATAVVLSPVYAVVTWQLVKTSHYYTRKRKAAGSVESSCDAE
jgi:hypothetical protein